jgi:hypothetical protein
MDLNVCTLVGLRYHTFSTCPPYPYKLFPWARHRLGTEPSPYGNWPSLGINFKMISWNGISSPFGDPYMETESLMCWIQFPNGDLLLTVTIWWPPYGKGKPYVFNPHMKTVFTISIWEFAIFCFPQMQKSSFFSRWRAGAAWLNGRPNLQSPFPHRDSPYGNRKVYSKFSIWGVPVPK